MSQPSVLSHLIAGDQSCYEEHSSQTHQICHFQLPPDSNLYLTILPFRLEDSELLTGLQYLCPDVICDNISDVTDKASIHRFSIKRLSNEEVDIGLFCALHVSRYTSDSHAIQKFFSMDAHDVHCHLASYEFNPIVHRLLSQFLQRRYILFPHQVPHEFATYSHHIQLGQFQSCTV